MLYRKLLLNRGAKPNLLGKNQRPIIFSAVEVDSSAIVQVILDFKGDLEHCGGPNGETPLLWAAAQGSVSCLKLLSQVAITSATDSTGKGVLSVAICHHQVTVVETLLQFPEIDVDLCDERGISPLRHAVREGQHHAVRALLENPQVETSTRGGVNEDILYDAIERDHLEVVRVLLCCDFVTRNSCRLKDGFSPLHCAVRGNEYLPKVAFESYDDRRSYTHTYSGVPSRTILKLLLESGLFDVNAADRDGMTALHHACMFDSMESSALEGIKSGSSDKRYRTAKGHLLTLLCSAPGINLDLVDHRGETALHKAVTVQNATNINVLMAKGVSVNVKDAKQVNCPFCEEDDDVGFKDLSGFERHIVWHYYG